MPNGSVFRMFTDADDYIPNRLFWHGFDAYEPETLGVFYKLARRARVTIDVGAYVGLFALVAALAHRDATAFAFEPMHDTFQRLRRNIELNPEARVHALCAAVADYDGTAAFYFTNDGGPLPSSTSLSKDFMATAASGLRSMLVPVVSLDHFAETHGIERIDLMKLDTESTEHSVLAGAQRILRSSRPHIICEVLSAGSPDELAKQLRPHGYRYYHLGAEGVRAELSIEARPRDYN